MSGETEQKLRGSHLGAGLNEAELRSLAAIAQARKIRRGQILFMEGDPATGFFVLLGGGVRIFKAARDGREYTIHQIRPGQMFAEVAIFRGERFPANCMATEDSIVAFFPKDRFIRLIQSSPDISLKIIGSMAAFLRDYNLQIESLSLKEVPARLATWLAAEAGRLGSSEVALESSKAELARRLGTISETLSRALKKLRDSGVVAVERHRITIRDTERLNRIARGEKL